MDDKTKPTEQQAEEPKSETKPEEIAREEIGGQQGPEPTRFGDWEKAGRCSDF